MDRTNGKDTTSIDDVNLEKVRRIIEGVCGVWANKKILWDDWEIYSNGCTSLCQLIFNNTDIEQPTRSKTKELYWVLFLVLSMTFVMSNLPGNLTTHVQKC